MRPEIAQIFQQKAPCDGCEHFNNCKENELACRAFLGFVVRGAQAKEYTAKIPRHSIFNELFNEEDDRALQSYLKSITAKKQEDLF